MTEKLLLIWHRNDLRVQSHAALTYARELGFRVVGCFFDVESQWRAHDHGDRKIALYRRAADELQRSYRQAGLEFHLETVDTYRQTVECLGRLLERIQPAELALHAEYELNEYLRDCQVADICRQRGVRLRIFHDQIMISPEKIRTKAGQPFKVYTPFMKCWRSLLDHPEQLAPLPDSLLEPLSDSLERQAQIRLQRFVAERLDGYSQGRDFYARSATAEVSSALAIGLLSTRQCHVAAMAARHDYNTDAVEKWRNELIWREFYKYISYHFPHVCRGNSFRREYDALSWNDNSDWLEAWQHGQTGYPAVDAAQRCLLTSGFMPNRLRMVTAMFLSKDLGLDWRAGERWFMQQLTDGDFSANNGGWQWSASTGVDAAPYFRIFNPLEQSKKFDPDGDFIRLWVPELSSLSGRDIHWPSAVQRTQCGYPQAIVEHKQARLETLERFKRLKTP
ncbi:cryptochrome/photolyase family protein [Gynuella sp.]|uniref:cryptochrome/photolyase family protein n=1 Tax=Gynuella sp. TaxID=2969146 RepID=UPI003D0B2EA9